MIEGAEWGYLKTAFKGEMLGSMMPAEVYERRKRLFLSSLYHYLCASFKFRKGLPRGWL